jgi:hypothetical protein
VLGLSNRHQHSSGAVCPALEISFRIGNLVRRVVWMVSFTVHTCTSREVLEVHNASELLLNCSSDVPTLYVLPMKKHDLELVASTCTMSCNALLHDYTRHMKACHNIVGPHAKRRGDRSPEYHEEQHKDVA